MHDDVHVTDVARACVLAMTSDRNGEVVSVPTGIDATQVGVTEGVARHIRWREAWAAPG